MQAELKKEVSAIAEERTEKQALMNWRFSIEKLEGSDIGITGKSIGKITNTGNLD